MFIELFYTNCAILSTHCKRTYTLYNVYHKMIFCVFYRITFSVWRPSIYVFVYLCICDHIPTWRDSDDRLVSCVR